MTVNEVLGDARNTLLALNDTVRTGWIGALSVNSSYFMASVGGAIVNHYVFRAENEQGPYSQSF